MIWIQFTDQLQNEDQISGSPSTIAFKLCQVCQTGKRI